MEFGEEGRLAGRITKLLLVRRPYIIIEGKEYFRV